MGDGDEKNDTHRQELSRSKPGDWLREWLRERRNYEHARMCLQTMASDVNSQITTRIKIASSRVVKHKTAASWTNEDLGEAGILEQHRPYTLKLLKSTAEDPYYQFLFDDEQEKIARWVTNSSRGFEIDETWWREMFRWTYGRDIEEVIKEYIRGKDWVAQMQSKWKWPVG